LEVSLQCKRHEEEAQVASAVSRIPSAGLLLTIVAMGLAGCNRSAPAVDPPATPEVTVTVAKPVVREVTDYFEFPGQTEAVGEVEVRAQVTGYIVKIPFRDGQEVKAGDLLFEIDPEPYQAALDKAKGDLERLCALLAKAQKDVDRSERLRPTGAISEEEHEQHLADLDVHKASIRSAQAAVRDAELKLRFTRVVSPIDGQVSKRRVTEGNLVQTGSNNSTVLTTVVTMDPMYVCFHVEEPALLKFRNLDWRLGENGRPKQLSDLKIPVEIGLANEEGFPHRGVIDFLDNKVDCCTGTICVRGVFQNAKRFLTAGMFVRVRVPFGKPHQALLVSQRAIGSDQRQKYLLTVSKDNVVRRREVKLGSLQDGMRVIESGIEPEDLVVIAGLQRARPGMTVKPHFSEHAGTPTVAGPEKHDTAVATAGPPKPPEK
jgi:RND family efflux transporter MFP subunit